MTATRHNSLTPAAWIRAHAIDAPEPLLARVEGVLSSPAVSATLPVAEALLRAGEVLLDTVLEEGTGEGRAVALDLLAADACVTWAFEAGADEPGTLSARAEAAMQRIAEVAL